VGPILTGAEMYYERFELKQTLADNQLVSKGNKILQRNRAALANSHVVLTAFNRDLIILGQVPNSTLKAFVVRLMTPLEGKRRLFDELTIERPTSAMQRLQDGWLTAKIRSKMLVNNEVSQKEFKVVTENAVVYVIGDVMPQQAKIVVSLARQTRGVKKVVRVFRYYQYLAA
jgi:osmotically-inducible protein OsmY